MSKSPFLTLLAAAALIAPSLAEARAGRGFGGFRKSTSTAPVARATPTDAAKPADTGRSFNAVVPVPIWRGSRSQASGASAAPAQAAAPLSGAAPPRSTNSAAPALSQPSAAARPWCETGKVVSGLCVLN